MKDSRAAVRHRSRGFRIATATAQVALGCAAGYLINWATLLATLDLQIATGWNLPWLTDIWLIPLAVTLVLITALWSNHPKIRIALTAATTSSLLTSAFFVWIFATW
ncbi:MULTISPECIES: hypothetical protein [unclassified Nocardia]|uniref:hypothetical protein n=1 Tax=unclassified Nocardia TaxID=2637762 RepID=UPI0033AC5F3F